MSDLRDLYQDVILDHGRNPRNHRRAAHPNRVARGFNPLCGDQLELFLEVDPGGVVKDVSFVGKGCAISQASGSLMTQALKGRSVADARALFHAFHDLVTGKEEAAAETLGKLAVFAGVRDYPNRVKCASLAWHTLSAALDAKDEPVTTE